jgi:hypothetical protein
MNIENELAEIVSVFEKWDVSMLSDFSFDGTNFQECHSHNVERKIVKLKEFLQNKIKQEQWINQVYELFCKSQGAPENEDEKRNLREWAEVLADGECNYFAEGYTPKDAHDEELSYS